MTLKLTLADQPREARVAKWDYKLDGGTYSGDDDEVIVDLLGRGRLHGHDLISKMGTEQWVPIEKTILWNEHKRRKVLTDRRKVDLPKAGRARGTEFYVVWFLITVVTSGFAWNAAENYNPEGNGLFNLVEASLLNNAWLKVIAALLSATFTSLFFAAVLIASRVRAATAHAREGYIAMIEEMQMMRNAIERLIPTPALDRES